MAPTNTVPTFGVPFHVAKTWRMKSHLAKPLEELDSGEEKKRVEGQVNVSHAAVLQHLVKIQSRSTARDQNMFLMFDVSAGLTMESHGEL